jgi:CelD/BcsL family acetyltransferase involved in cellulose biosynthesis
LQCFVYNNKIYHYNGGFDINYNNYDIGFIRFLYSIEHAISEGIIEFDFLKGVEEYKHRLGNKTIPVSRVVILRKNSKGYFVSSVKSTKNFIKKIIGL